MFERSHPLFGTEETTLVDTDFKAGIFAFSAFEANGFLIN